MKAHICYIGIISLSMFLILAACGSSIVNDDYINNSIGISKASLLEYVIGGYDIDNSFSDIDYMLSPEAPSDEETGHIAASVDYSTSFYRNIFIGEGESVGYHGGDELAWYYDIWGFGASGIDLRFIEIVGVDVFIDWTHQFVGHGNPGWRNRREANLVTFINDFNITIQNLHEAQEATFGMPMDEIDALINWARHGVHVDVQDIATASSWAIRHSLSDIEALVSNDVSEIWAAFPGYGIYNNGRAYSPEWVLNNIEAAVIQEQLPLAEITRIIEMASLYECLDYTRYEAEVVFHIAVARLSLITAIVEAESRSQQNYTHEAWANMQHTLEHAFLVRDNQHANEMQINEATENLWAALYALEGAPPTTITLNIFNNGPGGSPSGQNPNLQQAGTIRIWPQEDSTNTSLPMSTIITAVDEADNNAMDVVRINQMWGGSQGWLDTFNYIDINKNAPWQTITLSITTSGQTIEAILVNSNHTPEETPYFHTRVYAEDWRPIITIWFFQGGPRYTNQHRVAIYDIVLYVDGQQANIRDFATNIAPHQTDIPTLQISRDLDWQEMTITVTELGETVIHTFTR